MAFVCNLVVPFCQSCNILVSEQVVIVPILKKNTDTEAVLAAADALAEAAKAAGLRAKVDAGTEKTPGFKFSYWEMKVRANPISFETDSVLHSSVASQWVPACHLSKCRQGERWSGYLQGVPVRVEVGPRDVAQGTCVAARRDRPGKEGKQFGIPLEPAGFVASMRHLLDEVHVSDNPSYVSSLAA